MHYDWTRTRKSRLGEVAVFIWHQSAELGRSGLVILTEVLLKVVDSLEFAPSIILRPKYTFCEYISHFLHALSFHLWAFTTKVSLAGGGLPLLRKDDTHRFLISFN